MLLAAAFVGALIPTPSLALASLQTRVWVSGHGSDAPTCGNVTAPCRSLNYALAQTAPGGEIDILDAAGYGPGPVVISQSVSIVNDGVGTAGLQAINGANALIVQAGPSDSVLIRGLSINGGGSGGNGIYVSSVGNVTISNCTIKGFAGSNLTGNGILFNPASGTINFAISDTLVAGNAWFGVYVFPTLPGPVIGSTGVANGSLTRVDAVNNGFGVGVNGNFLGGGAGAVLSNISASHVNATGSAYDGFYAQSAYMTLSEDFATNNARFDLNTSVAFVYSFGNNTFKVLNAAPTVLTLQ